MPLLPGLRWHIAGFSVTTKGQRSSAEACTFSVCAGLHLIPFPEYLDPSDPFPQECHKCSKILFSASAEARSSPSSAALVLLCIQLTNLLGFLANPLHSGRSFPSRHHTFFLQPRQRKWCKDFWGRQSLARRGPACAQARSPAACARVLLT